jgi:type VI secretion system protein ImpF
MPRADYEIRVTPSLLDRLIVKGPGASAETSAARTQSLRELEISVERDLNRLLNTRQCNPLRKRDLGRAGEDDATFAGDGEDSPFGYGLPDFSSASVLSTLDQNRVRRAIELAIKLFEPRLILKEVKPLPSLNKERAFRFRIVAGLKVEPAPEPVTYETVFHLHSGEYKVEAR